jgi:glycosyltransferase 2 family protein
MRSWVRTVLILAVTIALLAFFFRDANFADVWAETRRANAWLLLAAVVFTFITHALRAWRWQSLLAPIGPTRFSTAFETTIIGFAVSFFIPARPGEVVRPFLLARKEGLPPTAAFATVVLERLLDLVTVLLLFGIFVFTVPAGVLRGDATQFAHVKFWGGVAGAAALAGLVLVFTLAGHPERLGRAAGRIERVLPARAAHAVARFVESFAQGLAVMRQPARLAIALLQSVPVWLSIGAGIWLASRAFSITFPYSGSFLVMALLTVGVAVPTPGQIGGFHAAYQIAVQTFFNASYDRAVGAALVLHAVSFVPVSLLGVIYMAREGLTFQNAQQIASSETT